jgi:hypothetical protein
VKPSKVGFGGDTQGKQPRPPESKKAALLRRFWICSPFNLQEGNA